MNNLYLETNNSIPVGIIVANYNNAEYIIDALKSALTQDYNNCTVFVSDDCSTDNSVQVIRDFCGQGQMLGENADFTLELFTTLRFPIYFFAMKKNIGRGGIRNPSISLAIQNGLQYVKILDADDILMSNNISTLLEKALEDPEGIGIVYSDYIIVRPDGLASYESKPVYDYSVLHSGRDNMVHSSMLISAKALTKCGLYNPSLQCAEDLNLSLRITKHFMCIGLPQALMYVRSHAKDSTNSLSKETWSQSWQMAMQDA